MCSDCRGRSASIPISLTDMGYDFDLYAVDTPYYAVDERLLKKNLKILSDVRDRSGAKILLAQKAFSMFCFYPLIGQALDGTTASSLYEARLGKEKMGGETHIFSPAYKDKEIKDILSFCDHLVFNSYAQWNQYKCKVLAAGRGAGVRVNPGYSEVEKEIYNPCAPLSRLGVTAAEYRAHDWSGTEGIHFHTLCEQNADTLERTLPHLEKNFGEALRRMKWLNLGGGHHITRADYDIEKLIDLIKYLKNKYELEIYLEPGEAVALNAGVLVAEIIDIVENCGKVCILDASAACHMPDVLEMPYRPRVTGAGNPGEYPHTYRLAGPTCLAGDVIGDYSFPVPLAAGDRLIFEDMAIYSMVKNNTFNGIALPSITAVDESGIREIKRFSYEDFEGRLS